MALRIETIIKYFVSRITTASVILRGYKVSDPAVRPSNFIFLFVYRYDLDVALTPKVRYLPIGTYRYTRIACTLRHVILLHHFCYTSETHLDLDLEYPEISWNIPKPRGYSSGEGGGDPPINGISYLGHGRDAS